jgi:hypothetical protein
MLSRLSYRLTCNSSFRMPYPVRAMRRENDSTKCFQPIRIAVRSWAGYSSSNFTNGLDWTPVCRPRDAADFLECVASRRTASLPALRLKPTREEPLNSIEELATAEDLQLPIYYRPTSERFPGVDGLILTADAVVLIQVTVSSAHALKREHLVPLYNNLPAAFAISHGSSCGWYLNAMLARRLRKRKFNVDGDWPKIGFYWCLFPFDTGVSFWIRLSDAGADVCATRRVPLKA